jgi:hypothetical protein
MQQISIEELKNNIGEPWLTLTYPSSAALSGISLRLWEIVIRAGRTTNRKPPLAAAYLGI